MTQSSIRLGITSFACRSFALVTIRMPLAAVYASNKWTRWHPKLRHTLPDGNWPSSTQSNPRDQPRWPQREVCHDQSVQTILTSLPYPPHRARAGARGDVTCSQAYLQSINTSRQLCQNTERYSTVAAHANQSDAPDGHRPPDSRRNGGSDPARRWLDNAQGNYP